MYRPRGLYTVDRRQLVSLAEPRLRDLAMKLALHDTNSFGCDACSALGEQSAASAAEGPTKSAAALAAAKAAQAAMHTASEDELLVLAASVREATTAFLADPANRPAWVAQVEGICLRIVGAVHVDACLKFSSKQNLAGRDYQREVCSFVGRWVRRACLCAS